MRFIVRCYNNILLRISKVYIIQLATATDSPLGMRVTYVCMWNPYQRKYPNYSELCYVLPRFSIRSYLPTFVV